MDARTSGFKGWNVSDVVKESFILPMKEYRYFMGVGLVVLVNFLVGNLLFLWKNITLATKFGYVISLLITTPFLFAIVGNYVRDIYVGKRYGKIESIKKGIYSTGVFLIYVLFFSSLLYFSNQLFNSSIVWFILAFSFSIFLPSYALEIFKVFYLEEDIFSLIEFLERSFSLKYLIATLIVIAANIIIINILISNLSHLISLSISGMILNSILQSIVFSYMNLFSITVYLKMFWG